MFLKSVFISLARAGYQIAINIKIAINASTPVQLNVVTPTRTLFVSSCPDLITDPYQWNVKQLIQILGTP